MKGARVLVLGVAGMLGHKLWQNYRDRFETWGTLRSSAETYARYSVFDADRIIDNIDVSNLRLIERLLEDVRPQVVINCIGIVKQLVVQGDPTAIIAINALFPHQLATVCRASNARLIHISTDCVFSGRRGMYTEEDVADADDAYGRTKYLGEVTADGCLTLRTSLIGRELCSANGLVEWFLNNRGGTVHGYRRAIFSGFTTIAMSDIIGNLVENHSSLSGVYHVAAEPIDKFKLLEKLRDSFGVHIQIEPDSEVQVDRSLSDRRFRHATGIAPVCWDEMIRQLTSDSTPYELWRKAV